MEGPVLARGTLALGSSTGEGQLTGVTTGTGRALDCFGMVRDLVFYVEGAGTISAGVLVIEEASEPTYAGTWSQIGTSVDATALTAGACQAVHIHGVFGAVRVRITTNIAGGGTVAVKVSGN